VTVCQLTYSVTPHIGPPRAVTSRSARGHLFHNNLRIHARSPPKRCGSAYRRMFTHYIVRVELQLPAYYIYSPGAMFHV